jgi:hypothetical protein
MRVLEFNTNIALAFYREACTDELGIPFSKPATFFCYTTVVCSYWLPLFIMKDFLNHDSQAISLDDEEFDSRFPAGVKRSDFLLFKKSTVCEFKELINFDAAKRVEHLAKKEITSESNFKRDFYKRINDSLSSANQQIAETKRALDIPEALGLVIIENLIPNNLSSLTLLDAADRKMKNGLESVDCVLCLDLKNTFVDQNGSHIRPIQIIIRDTERSKRLSRLIEELLKDFAYRKNMPIYDGLNIPKADQRWVIDSEGRYKEFTATINTTFRLPKIGNISEL